MGRREKKETPFRRILCQMMESSDLSVREAARIAGVPPSTLANWRAGATPDDHLAIKRLATYFGITLDYFLTGEAPVEATEASLEPVKIIFDGFAKITIHEIAINKNRLKM